jgi:hypothetical protein
MLKLQDDIKDLAQEYRLIDQTEPSGIDENLLAPEGEVEFDTTKTNVRSVLFNGALTRCVRSLKRKKCQRSGLEQVRAHVSVSIDS